MGAVWKTLGMDRESRVFGKERREVATLTDKFD